MQAVRFIGVGRPAQIDDIPKPSAGPGQVLIKVGGAGVCHSDLHVMEEDLGFRPPFTLGHENAGWVSEIGEGVTGLREGDAVAVYGPWGCGRCHVSQLSMENYCEHWASVETASAADWVSTVGWRNTCSCLPRDCWFRSVT